MTGTDPAQLPPVLIDNATARRMGSGALLKINGADNGDQVFAMEYDMPPRRLGTPHTHTYEDQIAYVLSGELGYRIGDEEFRAPAGSTLFMPRGLPHVVFNPGDEVARMLEITTPANLFKMFEQMSEYRSKGGADELTMQKLREEFGFILRPDWIPEMQERLGITWAG